MFVISHLGDHLLYPPHCNNFNMVWHFLLSFSTIVVFSFPTEVFAFFDFFLNKQLNKPFTDTFNKTTGLQALTIASYCRFFKIGNNHSEFGILFYNLFLIICTTVSSSTLSQVLVNFKDIVEIYYYANEDIRKLTN